jgi:hypothetical protein
MATLTEYVARALGYYYADDQTLQTLADQADEALAFLRRFNPGLDEDDPYIKSMVVNYVRYTRSNALDDFRVNYAADLLSISDDAVLEDDGGLNA